MISNIHNDFQSLARIITEMLDYIQNILSNYYLSEESKKSVKKRQHKLKQTNY